MRKTVDSFTPRMYLIIAIYSVVLLFDTVTVPAATNVTYRLKWLFNTSVVGDLYAKDHGFFDKAGLNVTVKAGGPERDAIRELELGHAQFGVASADQVIRARAKGAPVVVLAQLFQVNPLQWIYRTTQKPIERIADLKGKTIGITYGGNDETIMRTLLAKANISEKEVDFFSVRYDYTPFYQKKVDIWPVYRNAQGIIIGDKLNKAGESIGYFNPADYGVQFVANSIVTSENMLKNHPQTVRDFTTALLAGWQAALASENEKKSLALLARYDRDTPAHIRAKQLTVTRGLILPGNDRKIGYLDIAAWQQTEKIMLNQNQIAAPVDVANLLKPQKDK